MQWEVVDAAPRRRNARPQRPRMSERPFIAWDGEGDAKRDKYILFGCSTGQTISARSLTATECFRLMMDVVQHNPDAIHVAFAFTYDVTMMIRSLPENRRQQLVKEGVTYFHQYRIEFREKKWFAIWDRSRRLSIRIYDIFTFFVCKAIDAWRAYLPDEEIRPEVTEGKAMRAFFRYENLTTIRAYMLEELELYRKLAERLRELLAKLDVEPAGWYGPGAVASAVLKQKGIRNDMARDLPDRVVSASAFAYFGGRFEQFHAGQYTGPIYATDRRSAYPYALSTVPSLSQGKWEWRLIESRHSGLPERGVRHYEDFCLLRVRYQKGDRQESFYSPSALPFRNARGLISYPNYVEGWYWGVEINAAIDGLQPGDTVDVIEQWAFTPASDVKPFAFLSVLYEQRAKWKREGNPVEYAAKLVLNSMYGKLAQRIGWNEEKRTPPSWHQLEWAGYITAHCRAGIYRAICTNPDAIISVETDGLFSTEPLHLGVDTGALGDWEVKHYDGVIYVQSGMYWLHKEGEWVKQKIRGFSSGDIGIKEVQRALKKMTPLRASTRRFAGIRGFWNKPTLGTWIENSALASWGGAGKRLHLPDMCPKCLGEPIAMHPLIIAYPHGGTSVAHDLPWRNDESPIDVHALQ